MLRENTMFGIASMAWRAYVNDRDFNSLPGFLRVSGSSAATQVIVLTDTAPEMLGEI